MRFLKVSIRYCKIFSFDFYRTQKSSNDHPVLQMGKLNPIEIKLTKARWPVRLAESGFKFRFGRFQSPLLFEVKEKGGGGGGGFPDGSVVGNLPGSARETGLIPSPGGSHMPQGN